MAAGVTYTPIATTTLGSSTTSYTFSSIPSTYTDLVLVVAGTFTNTNSGGNLRLNGDTGTSYSTTTLRGTGTTVYSTRSTGRSFIAGNEDGSSSGQWNYIWNIMSYANTSIYKTVSVRANDAGSYVADTVGLWRSASAINSVTFITFDPGISAGTTLTLYGIAAA